MCFGSYFWSWMRLTLNIYLRWYANVGARSAINILVFIGFIWIFALWAKEPYAIYASFICCFITYVCTYVCRLPTHKNAAREHECVFVCVGKTHAAVSRITFRFFPSVPFVETINQKYIILFQTYMNVNANGAAEAATTKTPNCLDFVNFFRFIWFSFSSFQTAQ